MRCPFCRCMETQVKDSRPSEDHLAIRRRRFCPECVSRFTTYERLQLSEIIVVKKNGNKVLFDRDKLAKSLYAALRKRPFVSERVEKFINGIVRRLELMSENEISSTIIGEIAMESLKEFDSVAYIRFASVYKDFKDMSDFQKFIQN